MEPRISVITLGVSNLEHSLSFYRDGLGLPTKGIIGQAASSLVVRPSYEIAEVEQRYPGVTPSEPPAHPAFPVPSARAIGQGHHPVPRIW